MSFSNTLIINPSSQVGNDTQIAVMPMVSCIMPTYNRRPFVARAIDYFLRQDYDNRELIIIDDGTSAVADLVPSDPRIRYFRQDCKSTIGAKRNFACERARGEIIAHWDDDDWMASWRLSYQVSSLIRKEADLCGLDDLLFYNPALRASWRYINPKTSKPWVAGATLCYTKSFWRKNPFPNINLGEDTRFIWSGQSKRILALENRDFYIAMIHSANTSPKRVSDRRWHRYPMQEIERILGSDLSFYDSRSQPEQAIIKRLPGPEAARHASASAPLVSCIMPTHNRRAFLPQAIRFFLRQDYPNKELIVVDDSGQAVSDLIPEDQRVRYLRVESKRPVGLKRNMAVEAARGEFIVHWDDDDWHAPTRLSAQMNELVNDKADVVALSMRYILSLDTMTFWLCKPKLHSWLNYRDMCCGTIAYRKGLWKRYGPYPAINCGEDAEFLKALPPATTRFHRLSDEELFVCVRHKGNTWRIARDWTRAPGGWQRIPVPNFLSAEDYQGYVSIAAGQMSKHYNQPNI